MYLLLLKLQSSILTNLFHECIIILIHTVRIEPADNARKSSIATNHHRKNAIYPPPKRYYTVRASRSFSIEV